MLLHHRQPIAWPRRIPIAGATEPSRLYHRLTSPLVMAVIAHLFIGARLATWRWTVTRQPESCPLRFAIVPPEPAGTGEPSGPNDDNPAGSGWPPPVSTAIPSLTALPDPPTPVLSFPALIAVPEEIVPSYDGPTVRPFFFNAPTYFGEGGTGTLASVGSGGSAGGTSGSVGELGAMGGMRSGGGPAYRRPPRPHYPAQARQNGWEGTTVLRVEILPTGVAGTVEVARSSGHNCLDAAACEAVRGARFAVDHSVWVEIPITFRLMN